MMWRGQAVGKRFHCKVILKKSQTKGSRTQGMGAPLSPSLSFSPFLKGPGAGVYIPLVRIISAIFIPLLIAIPATSTGGIDN